MDAELFQHPLSLKHELNLQWRDPVGQLKIPPRDTDPRFLCRREKGSFAFARASDGPGAPGWPKVGADRLKIRVQKVNGRPREKEPFFGAMGALASLAKSTHSASPIPRISKTSPSLGPRKVLLQKKHPALRL